MIAKSSGKIGDLIYGLPCTISRGIKKLCICPGEWGNLDSVQQRLQPLLPDWEITRTVTESYVDLDAFRRCPKLFGQHFTLSHCEMTGTNPIVLEQPWIKVEPVKATRIIVSRGFNTRPGFNYERFCKDAGGTVGFVGTPAEYNDFRNSFPACHPTYLPAENLLVLAQIIAGAEIFVGNQSAPLALAEAMKHPNIYREIGVPLQYKYHDQAGEVAWVVNHVILPKKGVFVDVGAHDGVTDSNSYWFEKQGWTGLCIEPNPQVFHALMHSRRCQLSNYAIGKQTETKFYIAPISAWSGTTPPKGEAQPITIPMRRLDDVLQHFMPGQAIDVLSIDTEGTEIEVLETINLDAYRVKVLIIEWDSQSRENGSNEAAILKYMADKPYDWRAKVGANLIFTRRSA